MQIKTTVRYHLRLVRMATIKESTNKNGGDSVEKKEPAYSTGENVKWNGHYGTQFGGSLKTKNSYYMIQQFHIWAYIQRRVPIQKDTCTSMFTTVLVTTVRTWKQPKVG